MKRIIKFLLCQLQRIKYLRLCKIHPYAIVRGKNLLGGANKIGAHSTFISSQMGYGSYMGNWNRFSNCKIGKYCSIGSYVEVISATHPTGKWVSGHPAFFDSRYSVLSYAPDVHFEEILKDQNGYSLTVGNDVWIGDHVLIKGGVQIGDGAVIAMGSVVTGDIPAYAIVGGVPAKVIRYRFSETQIERLEQVKWWDQPEEWIKEKAGSFSDIDVFLGAFE